jgi:hypothetical protein
MLQGSSAVLKNHRSAVANRAKIAPLFAGALLAIVAAAPSQSPADDGLGPVKFHTAFAHDPLRLAPVLNATVTTPSCTST